MRKRKLIKVQLFVFFIEFFVALMIMQFSNHSIEYRSIFSVVLIAYSILLFAINFLAWFVYLRMKKLLAFICLPSIFSIGLFFLILNDLDGFTARVMLLQLFMNIVYGLYLMKTFKTT